MPIRGVGDSLEEYRWIFSARGIEGIDAERARLRFTLNYRLTPTLQVGLEANPRGDRDRFGPLANWTVIQETRKRPALILGTSSDRIGTREGQAWFGTLSKNLAPWTGVPISPYVGTSWNDRDYRWLFVAGAGYPLGRNLAARHLWDGRNLHHTLDWRHGRHTFGLILAEDDGKHHLGVTFGTRF